jgi:hypothetical protein
MSGFSNTRPPREEKLPGVIGDPSALKNMRRGPSELNGSTEVLRPFLNTSGGLAASIAATANALSAKLVLCPRALPLVPILSLAPPRESRCMNSGADPALFVTTIPSPAFNPSTSWYGSWRPV